MDGIEAGGRYGEYKEKSGLFPKYCSFCPADSAQLSPLSTKKAVNIP
jgi:hypothetical protein